MGGGREEREREREIGSPLVIFLKLVSLDG